MANLQCADSRVKGANPPMRLESEVRRSSTLEQHFVHGRWTIIKLYVKRELREIVVRRRDEYDS